MGRCLRSGSVRPTRSLYQQERHELPGGSNATALSLSAPIAELLSKPDAIFLEIPLSRGSFVLKALPIYGASGKDPLDDPEIFFYSPGHNTALPVNMRYFDGPGNTPKLTLLESMEHVSGEAINSGDADKDFALGLALSDMLMGAFVSSVAEELYQSVAGGFIGGGSKVPKSAPEPHADKKSHTADAPGASGNTSFRTPLRSRGAEPSEGQASITWRPNPTYSATGVAPGSRPVRHRFYSNMSGLDTTWTDGRRVDDTKFPGVSSVQNEPLQPQATALFTCWKKICGVKMVAQMKPKGPVNVVVRGQTSGSSPDGKPVTGRTFWSITASKDDAVKCTSGIHDAGFMRYNTYHDGALGLHQAAMGPRDSSYTWESQRPSDTGPLYFNADSDPSAPPTTHRSDLVALGFGTSAGASPKSAHRFGRSLSRASGN